MPLRVRRECSRREESFTDAVKRVPVRDSQGQVRVFRGALHLHAMHMNQEEIASCRSHQEEGRFAGSLANGCEKPSKRLKRRAIR
jgi:hypothetical protein